MTSRKKFLNGIKGIFNKVVSQQSLAGMYITAPNYMDLNNQANLLFHNINVWFQNNQLLLNLDKTLYTDFSTNHTVKLNHSELTIPVLNIQRLSFLE